MYSHYPFLAVLGKEEWITVLTTLFSCVLAGGRGFRIFFNGNYKIVVIGLIFMDA